MVTDLAPAVSPQAVEQLAEQPLGPGQPGREVVQVGHEEQLPQGGRDVGGQVATGVAAPKSCLAGVWRTGTG
jgi:hypothetical protein